MVRRYRFFGLPVWSLLFIIVVVQLWDAIEYFIKGRLSTGYAILMDIDGNKSDFSYMPKVFKTPKIINLKRLEARSSWIVIFK